MHHTSATRGHWLVAMGAIVVVGSTMLQWWQVDAPGGLPPTTAVGISEGPVYLMFVLSVASLLLVTLPFASEKPVAIDHPLAYLALFAGTFGGYVWCAAGLVLNKPQPLVPWPPQRGVGFWLAAVGILLFARGVFEVFEERNRRLY
jgi:hypothetical protein